MGQCSTHLLGDKATSPPDLPPTQPSAANARVDNTRSYWQGNKVRLRGIEPGDWGTYADWNVDDDQARRVHAVPFPQSRESVRRFAESESVRGPENDRSRFVVESIDGEAIVRRHHQRLRSPRRRLLLRPQHPPRTPPPGLRHRRDLAHPALLFLGAALAEGHRGHL